MTLRALIAAIMLNREICLPSIEVGSNEAYLASYAIKLCWDNELGIKGQDNSMIFEWMVNFD